MTLRKTGIINGLLLYSGIFLFLFLILHYSTKAQTSPEKIKFVRQGVQRLIFDKSQAISLAELDPSNIIGLESMHPFKHFGEMNAEVLLEGQSLVFKSNTESETIVWLGGFNPFATYEIDLESCHGIGEVGFEFSAESQNDRFIVTLSFNESKISDARLKIYKGLELRVDQSIAIVDIEESIELKGKLILQMLGSGLTLYLHNEGLPQVIAQSDFNKYFDLREKKHINSFHTNLFVKLTKGKVNIQKAEINLSTGMGLADIRAITYENGEAMLDKGRLWFTMSIRGRALPHHIQGVFSMNPSVFDLKLEGIIVFDRNDGLLRNEVASHLFYDRNEQIWRGLTTGFSAYANLDKEKKQLLAIESKVDPRFGYSIMKAEPFGMVGDIEDPHIMYDSSAQKWRMLTCENNDGYRAILLESDSWNKGYYKISGPVSHNSTGTSIQKIGEKLYCFSGSSERAIWIYSYPDLKEVGNLQMDLPPWDSSSGTRVWPNVIQLPNGYPFRYVALMMDRYNYPGLKGPNWTYGAVYLYHGIGE